ncbi:deoxyribonuclease V [Hydrocarboniclastica marina]|uniref:Endonuclease V n=1 Tax=Hydrocarboniclastica marina TaxID=2259620 RepID=A0A4P7XCS0_9ALTE|nr:deoxyribonuclease V [Hydrocarboniclastica marina]MAL98763.1 deoxyribonuclease V [Alteromonadaceae bacterium]QCF24648.1 deoxyribonuclease V [Hydrocarboniclastica marina]
MEDPTAHWSGLTPREAIALQREAASRVVIEDDLPEVKLVAGVDVGFENRDTARAAIVVLRLEDLKPVDHAVARLPVPMPYIPGLLSFRECPVILEALSRLRRDPDLLLCDGHGIAHPRRLGVASHTGLLTGLPTIGVGKSRLTGTHGPVPEEQGGWTPLVDKDEEIGAVLRTRSGVKPLYISAGHRISLETALHYVLACTTRYRLPETTRWADGIASDRGQKWLGQLTLSPD